MNVKALVKRLLFATTLAFSVSYSVLVLPATTLPRAEAQKSDSLSITADELLKGLSQNLSRVDEFRFLQEQANKLGVKVYLFGGTAAAFAHYVKWDLLRIKGDTRFHPVRFDYRYINIYRSTQDLDIVVDGPITAIQEIQKALQQQFPYLQGSKTEKDAWEVRSLRENLGDKLALLNNPDFLQQHTDSKSVGLIEVTDPASPQERVRDLRDWENRTNPGFLRDIVEGKIHYYFSETHNNTKFYLEGRNPPILSAVRYFIKVLQLDLEMRTEDLNILQKIINEFEPDSIGGSSYLKKWFQENGPKLIQNAIDVERAMKLIEHVGLRQKLLQVGSIRDIGSLAWWMNKKPLESFPLLASKENPDQQTAADLKLNVIAHETTSFQVFEAITRSHKLLPNVLISRKNHAGETAAYGDGFYAMVGDRSGFHGTGFTIRFTLDPRAILNRDFTLHGNYIIIKNRNAIRVIPENLKMDLIEYYNWLGSTDTLSKDDLGIYERLRLAMRARFIKPTSEEITYLNQLPLEDLSKLIIKDLNIDSRTLLLNVSLHRQPSAHDVLTLLKILEANEIWQSKPSSNSVPSLPTFVLELQERGVDLVDVFISKKPGFGDLQTGLELGLFQNHPVQFIKAIVPHLGSPEDILSLLRQWKEKIPNLETSLDLNRSHALLGRKFFQLAPSISQIQTFNELIRHPILSLSLGSKNPSELEVFKTSLNAGSLNPSNSDAVLKVWNARKKGFWAASPDKSDLIDFITAVRHPAIQAELMDRLVQYPRLRREEVFQILSAVENPSPLDGTASETFKTAIQNLSEKFFTLNPTITEVAHFLNSKLITSEHRIAILASQEIPMQSTVDLLSLGRNLPDRNAFKAFFKIKQDQIRSFFISKADAQELIKLLDYSDLSVVILEAYANHHLENNLDLIELISNKFQIKDSETILRLEALWIKGLGYAKSMKLNSHLISKLKTFAPTSHALALVLSEQWRMSNDLRSMLTLIQDDSKTLIHGPNKINRRSFGTIVSERLPMVLEERLPQWLLNNELVSLTHLTRTLDLTTDASTYLRILDIFLTSGLNGWGFYPWSYSAPEAGDQNDFRPRVTNKAAAAIDYEIVLYTIIHRAKVAASRNGFSGDDYTRLLIRFFSVLNLENLALFTEEDFLIEIIKYYLLVGIKNTVFNETRAISISDQEQEIENLLGRVIEFSPKGLTLQKKLQRVVDGIRKQYEDYPYLTRKRMTKKTELEALKLELQKKIDLADSRINHFLRPYPYLTERVNTLLRPPPLFECKKALTY
jgi:hypothetical protein